MWFWKAINAGDRVDSALKDMAVVMKQLDRAEEAIEAVKSFRLLCPKNSQESLDNVLIDLYKVYLVTIATSLIYSVGIISNKTQNIVILLRHFGSDNLLYYLVNTIFSCSEYTISIFLP